MCVWLCCVQLKVWMLRSALRPSSFSCEFLSSSDGKWQVFSRRVLTYCCAYSTQKYDLSRLDNSFSHLTNSTLNKKSPTMQMPKEFGTGRLSSVSPSLSLDRFLVS